MLSLPLFACVLDVLSELAEDGVLSELLYAGELVLMSETIEGFGNKFRKIKGGFLENLKLNPGKTKVMFSGALQRMACLKLKFTCDWPAT